MTPAEIQDLRDRLDRAVAALRDIETISVPVEESSGYNDICPFCERVRVSGKTAQPHARDCGLAAVLRENP